LAAASEVAHRLDLCEVVFVPTGQPWQKDHRDVTPAELRFQMTVIATAEDSRFSVSRVDVDRPGPTYTVDTLRHLQSQRPGAELFFITGADSLALLTTWREPDQVMALAHLVGVTRPGHSADTSHLPDGAATILDIPALEISSTEVRRRVSAGEPVDYLLPGPIVSYVAKSGLYRDRG
jgi:nicotinate-nucleotide adenylyltransferase